MADSDDRKPHDAPHDASPNGRKIVEDAIDAIPTDPKERAQLDLDPRDRAVIKPLPGHLPPLAIAVVTTVVAASAVAFAVRTSMAGGWSLWLGLGIPYLVLAAYAAYLMYDEGTLLERVTPRGGDFTLGVLVAAGLLVASWTLRANIAPAGSEWQGWVARIYLVLGESSVIQRSAQLTIGLLAVAALQELTWRGMVQDALEQRWGERRGWIATAGLFALASSPTLFTLSDPIAGPNPLLVVAALGCGLAWGFMTRIVRRIWPAIFSHMAFLYFSAVQFHIPGLIPAPMQP
jgi:membrane protease YdiL (CAAX protease family)